MRLSHSLKKNRTDVKNAYGQDLARLGPSFAAGDGKCGSLLESIYQPPGIGHDSNTDLRYSLAESHSSLSAILFRLNVGFVSVMERFTRGYSTREDYQALVNLSNSSRVQAISTFEQLSERLSPSSSSLVPTNRDIRKPGRTGHHRKSRKELKSPEHLKSPRTKSVQTVSTTPLGPATTHGVSVLSDLSCYSREVFNPANSNSYSETCFVCVFRGRG